MKTLPLLLVLGLALSLCNLTNKLKEVSSGGASKSDPATASGEVERAVPSAAQIAALAGGQDASWDKQGMSWTVPPNWKEMTNETLSLVWSAPRSSANLIVSISPMDESFPTDNAIQASYEGAKTRAKNGEIDELKWVEINGLKGVQFRESNPEKPDGIRRLQWLAYRKYAGQVQLVNMMLASNGKDFPGQQDAMYGILYSTKISH